MSDCRDGECAVPPAPKSSPAKKAVSAGSKRSVFRIEAMDCATEEALIRKRLTGMPGVVDFQVDVVNRLLTVDHTLSDNRPLVAAISTLGMIAVPVIAGESADHHIDADEASKPWWPLALAGLVALASEGAEWFKVGLPWLPAVLAIVAIALGGLPTYRKGWIAIRNGTLNINALMSIAATGGLLIGQWAEVAMVVVLFALAERIEAASLERARNAIRSLLAMAPDTATVQRADGNWETVDVASVEIDTRVRLKPGERVPLDGTVISGNSAVDQAPITGESVPVDKAPGDALFAGTINQSGALEYRVTAKADNSTLARIIQAVEAAQGTRAPTQRFVDNFARVYTPVVLLAAVVAAVVPPLFFDGAWLAWIYKALVLLVIACPCALVISTPVTIVSGLSAGARRGMLIKGGVYLEQGRRLTWLALDKTGTITVGKPALTEFEPVAGDPEEALRLAVSLTSRSDHPVSRAVADSDRATKVVAAPVEQFEAILGRGVKGRIDGQLYYVGNHRLIEELGLCGPELETRLNTLEQQGRTTVLIASENQVLALFGVADTVKESSRQAIAELHAMGVRTLMLSGDNTHTAEAIARQVGIDEARGQQLPEDKVTAIASLVGKDGLVGMVGDGINDAPALARADLGFAMGAAGTDTAIETADVAIMDDNLRKIPEFIDLSRATARVLWQNIVLALGVKAVFLGMTLVGKGTMWMAVFADMGTSLLVVLNGLRLLRRSRATAASPAPAAEARVTP